MSHRQLQKCILYACKLETMHTENLKLTLTTRVTDFGLPLPILPGATASCVDISASTIWFSQHKQGRPFRGLSQIPTSDTHLAAAFSSIRTTWPSQLSC